MTAKLNQKACQSTDKQCIVYMPRRLSHKLYHFIVASLDLDDYLFLGHKNDALFANRKHNFSLNFIFMSVFVYFLLPMSYLCTINHKKWFLQKVEQPKLF